MRYSYIAVIRYGLGCSLPPLGVASLLSEDAWLANKTGTSYSDAAKTLEASSRLKDLPKVDEALRGGKLSGAQLGELANAATPENEATLLDSVQRDGFKGFKDRCAKARAARRSDEEEAARYARIRRDRFHRSWTDGTGAYRYEGMTTTDVGARLDAAIAAELEAVFKEARAEGRHEPHAAYRADALERLVTGGGAGVETTVVIRVDESRLRGGDGVCETAQGAPMPVDVAIGAILADAFVKVLATDGTDVTTVSHPGRHIPEVLRTAVNERDGWRCVRPGCDSTHRLQIHHYRIDYGKHGPAAYWNLAALCKHDHDLVTYGGHRLDGGPGCWSWIPPP